VYRRLLFEEDRVHSPLVQKLIQVCGSIRYETRRLSTQLANEAQSPFQESALVSLYVASLIAQATMSVLQQYPTAPFVKPGLLKPYLWTRHELTKISTLGAGRSLLEVLKDHESQILELFRNDIATVCRTLGILRVMMIVFGCVGFAVILVSKVSQKLTTTLTLLLKQTLERATTFDLEELRQIVSIHVTNEDYQYLAALSGQPKITTPTITIPIILKRMMEHVQTFVKKYVPSPFLVNRVERKCGENPSRECAVGALFNAAKEFLETTGEAFYRALFVVGPLMVGKLYTILLPKMSTLLTSIFGPIVEGDKHEVS
jgi:hypothetical protein